MKPEQLLSKLKQLEQGKLQQIVEKAAKKHKNLAEETIKNQLYAGKTGSGDYLNPKYSQDPFFKSEKSARKYAGFKKGLNIRNKSDLFPEKPFDVPDLIVSGSLFYDTINANIANEEIRLTAGGIYQKLKAKYGSDILEYNEISEKFLYSKINPEIKKNVNKFLNGL